MERELTCIICPRGCSLKAEVNGSSITVEGNCCPKGEKYAIDELTAPVRTVTSVVRVFNRGDTMVSVKTADPIPKDKILEVMEQIRTQNVAAPVRIGDIIIDDIFGTKVIATKTAL